MAGSLNRVMLIGRLTSDPEMKALPSGQSVAQLRLATNRYTSQDGERKEFTDYHDAVAWNMGQRKLADLAGKYLKKGSLVYLEGRLQTRSWEGKDGQKRYRTEINVSDIQFLESRQGDGEAVGPRNSSRDLLAAAAQRREPTDPDADITMPGSGIVDMDDDDSDTWNVD